MHVSAFFIAGEFSFNTVEENMDKRRKHIMSLQESSEETILSITVFPRIGCPPFTDPEVMPQPESSVSRYELFEGAISDLSPADIKGCVPKSEHLQSWQILHV